MVFLSDRHGELQSNSIHIWYAAIDTNAVEINKYVKLLSQNEVLRASKFKFQIDKDRFIISRAILKHLLGAYLNIKPNDIMFKIGDYGKPYFPNMENLKFNISHSGNMAVFAFVKEVEIGVDIEKVKDSFDVMDIAGNFFSTKEITTLTALPETDRNLAFYRCWTRKESLIKTIGTGLSFPLDSFSVSMDDDNKAELLETKWDPTEKSLWCLSSFVPHDGYIAAVAVKGRIDSIVYMALDDFDII
jgi:4'-phosphopantetheinyl transferase